MLDQFTRHAQGRNEVDDIHSTGTTSISDSKSYGTTFSAKQTRLAIHSPSVNTSPPQSRAQSPVRCQAINMDADLRGVGFISGTPTKETFTATLPSHSQRRPSQSPETNMAANMDDSDVMLDGSGMSRTSQIENCDESMGYQDDIVLESHKSSPRSYSPNLSTTGKMFPESPTYGSPSLEDISGNSEESEDDDLDLEKSADEALSLWFGIRLDRLSQPYRVIYAFEQVKERCIDILQDEGYYQVDDYHSQEGQDSEEDQNMAEGQDQDLTGTPTQPANTGGGRQSGGTYGFSSNNGNASGISNRKRSKSGTLRSSSSSNLLTKTRGPNKKRRVEGEYSCPYRKRNPLRFNVRDHEQCANRSFSDMPDLK